MTSLLDRTLKLRVDQLPMINPLVKSALLLEHIVSASGHTWSTVIHDTKLFNDICGPFLSKMLNEKDIDSQDSLLQPFREAVSRAGK